MLEAISSVVWLPSRRNKPGVYMEDCDFGFSATVLLNVVCSIKKEIVILHTQFSEFKDRASRVLLKVHNTCDIARP